MSLPKIIRQMGKAVQDPPLDQYQPRKINTLWTCLVISATGEPRVEHGGQCSGLKPLGLALSNCDQDKGTNAYSSSRPGNQQ